MKRLVVSLLAAALLAAGAIGTSVGSPAPTAHGSTGVGDGH